MKKIIPLFLFILIAGFFLYEGIKVKQKIDIQKKYSGFKIIDYKIEAKKYKLLVADTPEKWEKGLMYYRGLDGVDGMIFFLEKKEIQNFWNKNTFMNLNLLWIDDNKIIGKSFLPSIEKNKEIVTVSSPSPATAVIELVKK